MKSFQCISGAVAHQSYRCGLASSPGLSHCCTRRSHIYVTFNEHRRNKTTTCFPNHATHAITSSLYLVLDTWQWRDSLCYILTSEYNITLLTNAFINIASDEIVSAIHITLLQTNMFIAMETNAFCAGDKCVLRWNTIVLGTNVLKMCVSNFSHVHTTTKEQLPNRTYMYVELTSENRRFSVAEIQKYLDAQQPCPQLH